MKRRRRSSCIGTMVLLASLLLGSTEAAFGQPTTVMAGSILFYPYVANAGGMDTRLDLVNISNSTVRVRCFFLDGAEVEGAPLCTESAFSLILGKQGSLSWLASSGSSAPGLAAVPPVPPDFRGALTCVQTDVSGEPIGGNQIYGSASLVQAGDVARYGALALAGTDFAGSSGDSLRLGGEPEDARQYSGCPALWRLDHMADGAESPLGPDAAVRTELAVLPCSADYDSGIYPDFSIELVATNEFEQTFSAGFAPGCWFAGDLSAISAVLTFDVLGTAAIQTRLQPTGDPTSGFVIVAREIHESAGLFASTAVSAHAEGSKAGGDVLNLPMP